MKRICAWCKKELPSVSWSSETEHLVTHGICDDCAEAITARTRKGILEFLDELADPIFLVDGDARMISANAAAQLIVGKDRSEIEDHLGGEVFECTNADLPGGCGRTEHCKACAIRNSVMNTLATGKGVKRAPAYQTLKGDNGGRRVRFEISTEKVGDAVLLRIDSVD